MKRCHRRLSVVLLLIATLWNGSSSRGDDFALRDGDTVVFLGDSITAERTYGKLIEQYTLLRYPDRKIRFINAGRGGETAAGAVERLDRDVFAHHPTVLTVAYGINDIGWGMYANEEHKQQYLSGIETIVKRCLEKGVRVYVCSAAITAADPAKSENDYLQRMCDEGMALSRKLGGESIDVQRTMRQIQQKAWSANEKSTDREKKAVLHASDGIHLSKAGATAMAYAILKGLGAPALVSSVSIDAGSGDVVRQENCEVSDVKVGDNRVEFTRLDAGLPLNTETFFIFSNRFTPISSDLNGYELKITSLPPGQYQVTADDRVVSKYSAAQLAEGVNISSTTTNAWNPGGPWDAQATALWDLTEARHHLLIAGKLTEAYLPGQEVTAKLSERLEKENADLEESQRLLAQPRPYRFVIAPAPPDDPDKPMTRRQRRQRGS